MELILYDFGKRRNSTRQPTANAHVVGTYNVVLKTQTSMINPTFILQLSDINISGNYCKCMGRYYWIDDKVQISNNIVEYQCTLDVLATHKDAVAATQAYVEYADKGYNTAISDQRTCALETIIQRDSVLSNTVFDPINGFFILTVVSNGASALTGFTTAYAMSWVSMQQLANKFVTDQALWEEIKQWALSPYDAIVSCIWLPLQQNTVISGTLTSIYLGKYDTGVAGQKITSAKFSSTMLHSIPWYYNDYRNAPPYTTATLYFPCIGLNPVNTADLYGNDYLKIYFAIDCLTGDCVVQLRNNTTDKIIQVLSGNLAVSIPIAQVASNTQGIVSGAVGAVAAVGSLATGNLAGAALSMGAIALAFNQREVSTNGNFSGRAGSMLTTDSILTIYAKETISPDNFIGTSGRPVGRKMTLGSMSGYVKCVDASVQCNGTGGEVDMVNDFLNGGFWYE